jgi:uroporphyrinogen decarboxylase
MSIFLKAIAGEKTASMPVWMMRQAGRYLPEYMAIRKKVPDFMSLCRNHALAAEITLQPIERFDLDAAIVFSDILTIPDALGLGLEFVSGVGPVFNRPIRAISDINKLSFDVVGELGYVADAVSSSVKALAGRVPLIGFSGSPWTLAAYMIQGSGSKTFSLALDFVRSNPDAAKVLLECLTANIINYCSMQIEAGARVIMLFDSHGAKLNESEYSVFSQDYLQQIIFSLKAVYPDVPIILYGLLDTNRSIEMAKIMPDVLGVSHLSDLGYIRSKVNRSIVLQGNVDPNLLSQDDPVKLVQAVKKCVQEHGDFAGVINLGHGILPDARISQVKLLIDTVRQAVVAV